MNRRKTFTKAVLLIALAAGLSILIATWQTQKVQAIQDSEDRPNPFGFIELGAGQTARINVVMGLPSGIVNQDTRLVGAKVARRVRFSFDIYALTDPATVASPSCATQYHFLRRESCDVVLTPGEAASFDFIALEGTKVSASVRSLGGPDTREGDSQITPEPHLASTLEVREGARTIFVVPAAVKGFNPQPDPPGTP